NHRRVRAVSRRASVQRQPLPRRARPARPPVRRRRNVHLGDEAGERMSRRERLLTIFAGGALTALLLYPISFHPGQHVRADSSDGQFSLWNVAWVARTIVADPVHLFDANIFYPHRGTLLYSEANLVAGALAAPAYWATRNPYLAHNAVVLLMFFSSGLGMYLL